jgi:hypothetical protein
VPLDGVSKALFLGVHDRDARAGPLEQAFPIGDGDLAAGVRDQASILELADRERNRGPLGPDHLGQKLLGDLERRLIDALIGLSLIQSRLPESCLACRCPARPPVTIA